LLGGVADRQRQEGGILLRGGTGKKFFFVEKNGRPVPTKKVRKKATKNASLSDECTTLQKGGEGKNKNLLFS